MAQSPMSRPSPDVIGADGPLAKQSAVTERGRLRAKLIHDVQRRPTRPAAHADGRVAEVARASWEISGGPIA
jgi:hypothetical protein